MKKKVYSVSKIKTAQKFLSKYDLTFESLNEQQKESVVNYTYGRKYTKAGVWLLICCLIFFIAGAYLCYARTLTIYDQVAKASDSGEIINLHNYGKLCFGRGFIVGVFICAAFFALSNLTAIPLILKVNHKIFDAFLPIIKQSSDNEN